MKEFLKELWELEKVIIVVIGFIAMIAINILGLCYFTEYIWRLVH